MPPTANRPGRPKLAFAAASTHGARMGDQGIEPLTSADQPPFARAFREHYPDLLAFVRRQVFSDSEAADIAQEAWLRVLRYRDEKDLVGLRMLVFRIALNLISTRIRVSKKNQLADHIPLEDDIPLIDGRPSQLREIAAQQQVNRLFAALEKLPRKCREALVLRRFHGLSVEEIAGRMNSTPRAIESLISRGTIALTERMEKNRHE